MFKALSDETRRHLLDSLREHNGQTQGELSKNVDITRQSVAQHLSILEEVNLISVAWRGREKIHYLNPVPIHDVYERWIERFEVSRLRTLSKIRTRAEETMADLTYKYVTYIESSAEKVWEALTDPDITAEYWGHRNESDWEEGSPWQHTRSDGSEIADVVGTVVESKPPHRLVTTWADPSAGDEAADDLVTFEIEEHGSIVRLAVTHQNLANETERDQAADGWSAVMANLKTLLESGKVLSKVPWEMP